MRAVIENIGRRTVRGIDELGYIATLFLESLYWLVVGPRHRQPVRMTAIFAETMKVGVSAIPIVSVLCFAVGVMLAIQSIETLKVFGAESQVVVGIALSVTREFSPLIVGVLVAGRSGSAIAARVATMVDSQETDALRVIGISPVRFLAAPVISATVVAVPALTVLGDFAAMLGGAVYTFLELNMSLGAYAARSIEVLSVDDIMQGLVKSLVFAVIISLVGLSNGFQVRGGAEGIGKATTRAVVLAISFIVLADMVFTYFLNR